MKLTNFLAIFLSLACSCVDTSSAKNRAKVVATMADQIEKKFSAIPHITIESFLERQKRGEKLILVDVREPKEQQISMIPGAITKKEYLANNSRYSSYKVVAYCTIGYRSSEYVLELERSGVKAFNLKESILGWAHRKLEFQKDGEKTKEVHVYDEPWNLLPKGYKGVVD